MNCCINVRGGNKNLNFQHKCQENKGNSAQKECFFMLPQALNPEIVILVLHFIV